MKKLRIEGVETSILDVPPVRPHRFTRTGTDAHPTLLVTVITRASAVESARASCRPALMELFTGDIVRTEGRDQHRLASEGVATPPSTRGESHDRTTACRRGRPGRRPHARPGPVAGHRHQPLRSPDRRVRRQSPGDPLRPTWPRRLGDRSRAVQDRRPGRRRARLAGPARRRAVFLRGGVDRRCDRPASRAHRSRTAGEAGDHRLGGPVRRSTVVGGAGAQVRAQGTEMLVPSRTGTWFTREWAEKEPAAAERLLAMLRATPAEGYAACCEAIGTFDVRDRLGDILAPTLVVAGTEDPATTVDMVRLLADGIPKSEFVAVPGAAHLPNATHPEAVNAAMRDHFRD